jgi:hypothetical protein
MGHSRRACQLTIILALLLTGMSASAGDLELITPDEARLPAAAVQNLTVRALTRGPAVTQVKPAAEEGGSAPLPLEILFQPRNDVPINPSRVKVTYLKSPSVDLTTRVKPFLTSGGIRIERVLIPSGSHHIRIDVEDARGRAGSAIIILHARYNAEGHKIDDAIESRCALVAIAMVGHRQLTYRLRLQFER